ncbi:MAG: trehalose-6-phosphate synthase [Acidobacteriaceae bacterium]|nr:trehalose-6-phosphate synthase [Acidobacteriaceae bacterium]MBV9780389.1 trehalose-6-phosphate synthase [Acidobacteriaceae bacterium]
MLKVWRREVLREFVRTKLNGYRFILVSNREPFEHRHASTGINCVQPAGGLASALDPVMRACGGLWIAHGSGDADTQTVDKFDRVKLPPDDAQYTLRRVWLSKEEHEAHYLGLSNQGIWPLCHVAFTRPVFDADDWQAYRRVNERFAETVLEEAGSDPAFVFIQDYHFALLPRMLRNARPNLVIAQFWHVPWPNSEVFNLFPWKDEILDGLLGNDLLGFQLQHHCQNFLKTVDCSLEARVDESGSEICRGGHSTHVRPFPIGIDFDAHAELADSDAVANQTRRWREELSLKGKMLGIGIDRLDYTKGIPERLRSLGRLLEMHPQYRGKLVFAQIAVPSRSSLPEYRNIEQEVDYLTAQINRRWGTSSWRPIVLMKRNYNASEMIALHRLADFCVVSSLHDGMNLVAKEFAASRADEDGVLVLSKFTGAAHELKEALQVNPFSVEECANAYRDALTMQPDERKRRMRKMRESVEDNNVYRWAGKLLSELARVETKEKQVPVSALETEFQPAALGVAV